jgi:segregation and condensation protein B
MTNDPIRGAVEALLFVSDEPVSAGRLARVLEATPGEVEGGWRLYTHPAHHDVIEQYVLSWDTRRLSQAALEALAVVAYHQPVTRVGINAVRGVNSEGVLSSLIEKGLVREVGRDKNQGNAILYSTTRTFLEKFGLKDLDELPPLAEFAPDSDTERAIRDRLSATEGPMSVGSQDGEDDEIAEVD